MHAALRHLQELMPADISVSPAWQHLGGFMESMGGTPVRRHPTTMVGAQAAMIVCIFFLIIIIVTVTNLPIGTHLPSRRAIRCNGRPCMPPSSRHRQQHRSQAQARWRRRRPHPLPPPRLADPQNYLHRPLSCPPS